MLLQCVEHMVLSSYRESEKERKLLSQRPNFWCIDKIDEHSSPVGGSGKTFLLILSNIAN